MKRFIIAALAVIAASFPAQAGYETGAANQVLRVPSGGGRPVFGAVDLAQTAATTNQLPVAKGGTGKASITAGSALIGNGTSAPTEVAPSSAGNVFVSDGTNWTSGDIMGSWGIRNVGISSSISSNTLVIALKQSDGSTNCSSSASCLVAVRSATATTGGFSTSSITGAMSITLGTTDSIGNPSGAGAIANVYYLQDTSSEICVSFSELDEGTLQSATALTGGAETSATTLYCTNAHTSRPIRHIGRVVASWSNPNWGSITETSASPVLRVARGYPGQILALAGSNCPPGTLASDNSAVSRSTYSRLFGQVGTTYGTGDGSTTFNVPDYRGIFLRGVGTSVKVSYAVGGSMASSALGTYTNDKMQGHWHSVKNNKDGSDASATVITDFNPGDASGGGLNGTNRGDATIKDPKTDGTNGTPRTGNETAPAYTSVTYCIWY